MASPVTPTRAQLVYGLCLPLAALLGFFLADPMQFSSMAVVGLVLSVLVWPLFARWHHPLLVGSVHSVFILSFLPGALPLWMFVAFGGAFILLFRRCLDPDVPIFPPGGVPWALLALGAVVLGTALVRGGVGLRTFGSSTFGSKKYFFLLAAVLTYFVVVSRPVPKKHALFYVALYCLSAVTSMLSHMVYWAGGKFYWLYNFVDPSAAYGEAVADWDVHGNAIFRSGAPMSVAGALICFVLARYGLRGTLNLTKPWKLLLVLGCVAVGTLGGFRSFLVGNLLLLAVLFFVEGLHRTRYVIWLGVAAVSGLVALAAFSDRLPISVQRSISFLPVKVDVRARQDAQDSSDWRLEMWQQLAREAPKYALLGKGYAIDPSLLYFSGFNQYLGFGMRSEWAILAGDYHSGPLSVIIPFGIWGVLAFAWLIVAGVLRLRWFCRHCDPDLLNFNRALFAMFISKCVFFILFFGALNSDLVDFVMVVGLAECLNHASPQLAANQDTPASELLPVKRFA
jgi:hypothetical protein